MGAILPVSGTPAWSNPLTSCGTGVPPTVNTSPQVR